MAGKHRYLHQEIGVREDFLEEEKELTKDKEKSIPSRGKTAF